MAILLKNITFTDIDKASTELGKSSDEEIS